MSTPTFSQTISALPPPWLSDLVHELSVVAEPLSVNEAERLVKIVKVAKEELESWARFDTRNYTRTSVFRTESLELLVLGWLSGQVSPLHNHKGSVCALRVLAGEAIEISYEVTPSGRYSPAAVSRQRIDSVTACFDEQVHQVGNDQIEPLVTLHLYSPPLNEYQVFPATDAFMFGALNDRVACDEHRWGS